MVLWVGQLKYLGRFISRAINSLQNYIWIRNSTSPEIKYIWQSIQELKVSFERLSDIIDTEESNLADQTNIPLNNKRRSRVQ